MNKMKKVQLLQGIKDIYPDYFCVLCNKKTINMKFVRFQLLIWLFLFFIFERIMAIFMTFN